MEHCTHHHSEDDRKKMWFVFAAACARIQETIRSYMFFFYIRYHGIMEARKTAMKDHVKQEWRRHLEQILDGGSRKLMATSIWQGSGWVLVGNKWVRSTCCAVTVGGSSCWWCLMEEEYAWGVSMIITVPKPPPNETNWQERYRFDCGTGM